MGAIVDTLHVDQAELELFRKRFPACTFLEAKSSRLSSRFRIIIPDEDLEDYYLFLIDNSLALCSANFLSRVESDPAFSEKMRSRLNDKLSSMGGAGD